MADAMQIFGITVAPVWAAPGVVLAAVAAAVYLLVYCYRDASPGKSRVKTVSVGLLAALALAIRPDLPLLALALGLCALGDYFLSRSGDRAFLAGVGSFAAGHLAYIALFLTHPQAEPLLLLVPEVLAFAGVLALFGLGMIALLFPRAGELRWAVTAYVPVIVLMAVTSVAVTGFGPRWWVLPAALAFMVSDTVLATEMFVLRENHPLRRITPFVVWSLYWLAQIGFFIALGWGVAR